MVNQADRPLVKVTLNLFETDVDWFREHYSNFSEGIRDAISQFVQYRKDQEDNFNE